MFPGWDSLDQLEGAGQTDKRRGSCPSFGNPRRLGPPRAHGRAGLAGEESAIGARFDAWCPRQHSLDAPARSRASGDGQTFDERTQAGGRYRSALATDRTNCRLPLLREAEPRSRSLPTTMPIGTELRNHTSRILMITALSLRWSSVVPRSIDTLAGEVDGEMKGPRRVA